MKKTLKDTLRVRLPDGLKKRVGRVATRRGCDVSDVAREGIINFIESEERRLEIPNGRAK